MRARTRIFPAGTAKAGFFQRETGSIPSDDLSVGSPGYLRTRIRGDLQFSVSGVGCREVSGALAAEKAANATYPQVADKGPGHSCDDDSSSTHSRYDEGVELWNSDTRPGGTGNTTTSPYPPPHHHHHHLSYKS